jgi:hypothetical protein
MPIECVSRAREARAKCVHQRVCKVAMTEHEVVLERAEVDEKLELVKEYVEEALTGDLVSGINGALKATDIAVLER